MCADPQSTALLSKRSSLLDHHFHGIYTRIWSSKHAGKLSMGSADHLTLPGPSRCLLLLPASSGCLQVPCLHRPNAGAEDIAMQAMVKSMGGFVVLPAVVDISMLYATVNPASSWGYWRYLQPLPFGQVAGISNADAILAYALGSRLGDPYQGPLPISPVSVNMTAGPQTLAVPDHLDYDQLVQIPFLQAYNIVPPGTPLALTFTLTGDMCAQR